MDTRSIICNRYITIDEGQLEHVYINYVPKSEYPLVEVKIGVFELGKPITYTREHYYNWRDEYEAEQNNEPFELPEMPFVGEKIEKVYW